MNANEILTRAAGHLADRAKTYDKPEGERSMRATVEAFKAVTGHELTETQGWLFMVLLKAVRSQQGAFKMDSFEDGAAYFALAGESASGTNLIRHVQNLGDGEYEALPMIDPSQCKHESKRNGFACPSCGFTDRTDKFTTTPMGAPVAPSWADAPEWAQWLAQSSNGRWYWFEGEPSAMKTLWAYDGGKIKRTECRGFENPNWRNTLQQRPQS